jgi:20S proteasome subunit beta 5
MFSVGSGSYIAYSALDAAMHDLNINDLSLDDAIHRALWSVRHATYRDGFSGGFINVVQVNATGIHFIKRIDCNLLDLKTNSS